MTSWLWLLVARVVLVLDSGTGCGVLRRLLVLVELGSAMVFEYCNSKLDQIKGLGLNGHLQLLRPMSGYSNGLYMPTRRM